MCLPYHLIVHVLQPLDISVYNYGPFKQYIREEFDYMMSVQHYHLYL
jgi:hypothetical protein